MIFIDNLIYNTLLSRKAIYLPKAGTLSLAYAGAKRVGNRRVTPPKTTIAFSWRRIGSAVNIIDLIEAQGEYKMAEAQEFYERWLDSVRSDGRLTIDGVGVYDSKTFTPNKDLVAFLNSPQVNIMPERRSSGRGWWIVVPVVAAVLLVMAALFWSGALTFRHKQSIATAIMTINLSDSASVVSGSVVVTADTVRVCGGAHVSAAGAQALAVIRDQPGTAEALQKALRSVTASDTAATEVVRADTVASANASAAALEQKYKYYVVTGVFVIRANANRYAKRLRKNHPGLDVEVHYINEHRNIVTIFGSNSQHEALSMCNHSYGIQPKAWVWTRR
ncbi:MAG: hypothetical protein LBH06_06560 [Rikenellaceae bacterium]|jgi:hypothetical protein|nr:hypothetical protein [Rikenellaceae bacterium]